MLKGKNFIILLFLFVGLYSTNLFSQSTQRKPSQNKLSSVIGRVIDEDSKEALLYVNVVLLNPKDSSLVSGGTTDEEGRFSFQSKSGNFIMRLTYMGYKTLYRKLEVKTPNVDLGDIGMKNSATSLGAVQVTAQRSMVEYKLDKRVINVDQNIVVAGGDATDVLQTLPSVSVDEDGNVTFRGNSNVKVLVDGKPSELLGSDLASVLQQIPASTIESVEEITNPSAKYDPEGMSGIINIKLKEKGNRGFNGNFSVSAGSATQKLLPRSNASVALNYSTKKFAIYGQGNVRYRNRSNNSSSIKTLFSHDTSIFSNIIYSKRGGENQSISGGIKVGADWYINKQNTITLSYGGNLNGSLSDYDWIDNKDLWLQNSPKSVTEKDTGGRNGQFHNINLNYTKLFDRKGQELTLDATYNIGNFSSWEKQTMDYDFIADTRKKDESSSSFNRAVATLNYVHPFSEKAQLEAGYNLNYSFGKSFQDYFLDGNSERNEDMSYTYENTEQIHAIYATFGYNFNEALSAQAGLRGELFKSNGTQTMINKTPKSFDQTYRSLYPTLHLSYKLTKIQSMQLSYSRRVNRPRGFELLPTVDLSNPESIRLGNPNLKPEYTDAYELGYSIILPKTTIFASAYYRQTNDRISWFNFLWNRENAINYGFDWALSIAGDQIDLGKLAMTSMNITKSYNYGLEIIIDQHITNWWELNLSGNLFGNYTDGSALGASEVNSFNWDLKLTSTMKLKNDWNIQLSGQYQAPRTTIQGDSKAMYFADIAIRKSILNKKGSLALRFSDIFNTRKRANRTLTEDYFNYNIRKPYSQSFIITFSYRFGETNHQQEAKKRKQPNNESSIMENGEYEE
ncbi:MAG: TonB-dependent receptor [Bacteroidales bacterium]|jgi:outer membrane receptor protein involved in Fe transport|nr:TonB-dependent receptor [Bacteroidales bacterium]